MYMSLYEDDKWSNEVTTKWSPKPGLYKTGSADEIATYLKKNSKDARQAMSRLNFYINRAGSNLTPDDKKRLNEAKLKLQSFYS